MKTLRFILISLVVLLSAVLIVQAAPKFILQQTINPITDNTYDLGSSTQKWARVYATDYFGSGSNLTGISGSATTTINAFQSSFFTLKGTTGQIDVSNSNGTSTWGFANPASFGTLNANVFNATSATIGLINITALAEEPLIIGTSTKFYGISGATSTIATPLVITGNVGIGTSTPQTTLDVNGSSTIRGNIIQNSGAAGTSTLSIGQTNNQGCIEIQDSNAGGWSHITALNGVMYVNTGQCQ